MGDPEREDRLRADDLHCLKIDLDELLINRHEGNDQPWRFSIQAEVARAERAYRESAHLNGRNVGAARSLLLETIDRAKEVVGMPREHLGDGIQ